MTSLKSTGAIALAAVALIGPLALAGCGDSTPAASTTKSATTSIKPGAATSGARASYGESCRRVRPSDPCQQDPLPTNCPGRQEQSQAYQAGAATYAALKRRFAGCRFIY